MFEDLTKTANGPIAAMASTGRLKPVSDPAPSSHMNSRR